MLTSAIATGVSINWAVSAVGSQRSAERREISRPIGWTVRENLSGRTSAEFFWPGR